MNRYTIYCTPEQTKKALELGAPIENLENIKGRYESTLDSFLIDNIVYIKPTAEQMIGWLKEKGMHIALEFDDVYWGRAMDGSLIFSPEFSGSRIFVILAAIDATLDYLIKKKGE